MDEPPRKVPAYYRGTPARSAAREGGFDWLTLGAAAASFFLTVMLVFQRVMAEVDETGHSTVWDITGYWLTAAILMGIQVALLVRAIRLGREGLQFISFLALIAAMAASVMLSVPPMVGRSEAPVQTTNPNYEPCYSGSGDCVGG